MFTVRERIFSPLTNTERVLVYQSPTLQAVSSLLYFAYMEAAMNFDGERMDGSCAEAEVWNGDYAEAPEREPDMKLWVAEDGDVIVNENCQA